MATDNESFNRDLYDLLKVRGYKPVPLDSKNQRVLASQAADVIEFTFNKDGKDYGKAWVSIDDAANVIVYYDEEQQESPSTTTPGVDYDDSWTGFLKHLKNWSQRRQLSFELSNKDRLGDDMRQRDYYKMKERVSEGYHPMGKKASYNDAVPSVKIILQHNRALEEGEQRYRNVSKIFLENQEGERFLAPTTRPGIARVYARHIAEGGVPNDDKWNHIKTVVEDYNKMAGFVRATRNGQFNESAQELVNEGINHYNNLRETLHKLASHRGYQAYFESWTPTLMEDELDESINDLFVQEMVDPRIESAMPILSRLKKPVAEMAEIDSLAEWADSIINEKLDLDEEQVDENLANWQMGVQSIPRTEPFKLKKIVVKNLDDPSSKTYTFDTEEEARRLFPDSWDKIKAGKTKLTVTGLDENFIGMAPQAVAEDDIAEMDKEHGSKRDFDGPRGQDKTAKPMSVKKFAKGALKSLKRGMKGWEKGMHDVDSVKAATKSLSPGDKEKALSAKVGKGSPAELQQKLIKREKNKQVDEATGYYNEKHPHHDRLIKNGYEHSIVDIQGDKLHRYFKPGTSLTDLYQYDDEEVKEDLGPEQKRVGQLGPTEKVKNNNIGKLVGASESTEFDPELARIIEMAQFKR